MNLTDRVGVLKGVGEKTERLLNKLGIFTIGELLEYYPRNYDIYQMPVKIRELTEGQKAAVAVTLTEKPDAAPLRRLSVVTAEVADGTGTLSLKWYNMPYLRSILKVGETYVFRGKVLKKGKNFAMEQPEVLTSEEYKKKMNEMQPIYPLTHGLTNNQLIRCMRAVLADLDLSEEHLDRETRERYQLAEYNFSVAQIHFPDSEASMMAARRRLAFDEFYLFALAIQSMREVREAASNQYPIRDFSKCDELIAGLPYKLTGAQMRTWREIQSDLSGERVMNRLIQGDVGSGKTVIAQLALLAVASAGAQGCLMAPTEVLARQHYESFVRTFGDFGVRVELLTGSMTAGEKRLAHARIENHEADIMIGTHALIQEKVIYDRLALVITDEQHRFGVRQREFLAEKGSAPHVLVMSATPIPRTLAMILYGDLDISVIDEMPADRLAVKNCAVGVSYRPAAYRFIEKQVRMGHQAYVICPMVEESELADGENVIDYTRKLKSVFPEDICVEYLHGQQKPREKNEIMGRFAAGEIQVLVSTTVVEVGVDVPNATVMMVEDAQRFGLAQLHQLRGRVGRGQWQSYCIFVNTSDSPQADERLKVLVGSNDGFYIAGEDLRLRGPGDLFGFKQSGLMDFKIGDIYQDIPLLQAAGEAAKRVLSEDPGLKNHPILADKLNEYMKRTLNELIL